MDTHRDRIKKKINILFLDMDLFVILFSSGQSVSCILPVIVIVLVKLL